MTDTQIYNEITNWLATNFPNDLRTNWYVGVARNIEDRLFGDHTVHPKDHPWIHCEALNAAHARSAEMMLLKLGHDGGVGGGSNTTTHVYAFRKDIGTTR